MQKSSKITEPEVKASFDIRTKPAAKYLEKENDSTHKIDVYFPRSVCYPTTTKFRGVSRNKKRISPFYIGGINKRTSFENKMCSF